MSNIQKNYNAIKQTQTAKFTNSGVVLFERAQLTQGAAIFAAATLTALDTAGVFSTISGYVDQASSAKQENPLDFIGKAIGAFASGISGTFFIFIFLIFIAIVGVVVLFRVIGAGAGSAVSGVGSAAHGLGSAVSGVGKPGEHIDHADMIKPNGIAAVNAHAPTGAVLNPPSPISHGTTSAYPGSTHTSSPTHPTHPTMTKSAAPSGWFAKITGLMK
jgi:hypothetical protein